MAEDIHLLALATAVPPHVLEQTDVAARARILFDKRADIDRLMPVFANTGINRRYSCVPIDWYAESHGWKERTALYRENAVALLAQVADELIARAGIARADVDGIVVNSTTGIATPSLDALLVERLGLRRDIVRLPIFGLGCAGGVLGLSRAAALARSMPGARILFLVVELCALTFRKNDISKSNVIAAALFGDGAAGALLSSDGKGQRLGAWGEHTWPHSLDIMGWDVEEDGLKALFSQNIPKLVSEEFRAVVRNFAQKNGIDLATVDQFACHPGGTKVLEALESAFELSGGALQDSRAVLRDYGNMSAATVLFVLARMAKQGLKGRTLMSALGPGFSAAFQILEGP